MGEFGQDAGVTPLLFFEGHASGDTLQTDDRNVNIVEMTENEPEGWYYPTRYRKQGWCYHNVTWFVVEYTLSLTWL